MELGDLRTVRWQGVRGWLHRWLFSRLALVLLLGGVLWGTWFADVTRGDSANYYRRAEQWMKVGPEAPEFLAMSPLYTIYLAYMRQVAPDPGVCMYLHRVLIVLAGALAFHTLLRRVLPRAWAWFIAAWWVILPINWRGEYEGQYFAFAFLALAGALVGSRSPWVRGCGLAALGLVAMLMRNEYWPAVGLLGAAMVYGVWRRGEGEVRGRWKETAAVVLPIVILLPLVAWLLSGGPKQHPWRAYAAGFDHRHRINMAQVYPMGYNQRHDDFKDDPWLLGSRLMERQFGTPFPSFREMFRANPQAVREHIGWNLRLIPAGLQLGLLARFGDAPAPDFQGRGPERTRNPWPLTVLLLAVWGGGAVLLVKWWREKRRFFLKGAPAVWVWTFLICCLPTVSIGIITQRPRPNYIFPLLMLLMAFTGVAGRMLWRWLQRRTHFSTAGVLAGVPPVAAVALFCWGSGQNAMPRWHPTLDEVRRLLPYQKLLTRKHGMWLTNAPHAWEVGLYVGLNKLNKHTSLDWAKAQARLKAGVPLAMILEEAGVTELYLKDVASLPEPVKQWLVEAAKGGVWKRQALADYGTESWELWARPVEKKAKGAEKPEKEPEEA